MANMSTGAHIDGRNVIVVVDGEDSPELRKVARRIACGEAHTATIGKLLDAEQARGCVRYVWGPVTVRAAAPGPKPERVLPDFLRKDPVSCETCRDFGVVRKAGKRAGQPYRTKDGAAAALANGNAVKCPKRHRRAPAA